MARSVKVLVGEMDGVLRVAYCVLKNVLIRNTPYAIIPLLLLLVACSTPTPNAAVETTARVSLTVDGQTHNLTTEANNVRELLGEAGVTLGEMDEVNPPPFTPITDGLAIRVVRVSESVELLEQLIPFERKLVRNESMSADDPPIIIQGGHTGLRELTIRIVYNDGLEVERRVTQEVVVEEAQDEIMMIGVGATPGNVTFAGTLAFISGGNSVILRGASAFPEQLNTGSGVDHRVFSLSPTGTHLLYTRATTETEHFNSLWVISVERGAEPRPLGVYDVLWADWNPARAELLQIAYTTGRATSLLPGWEANNDLWVGAVRQNEEAEFEPERIIEAYPATYGWWGGNYAWSPSGRYVAYSYADEVGVIDLEATVESERRIRLYAFTEYNTRADWVWVPTLSWSPDGRYLAFNHHSGDDPEAADFDISVVDVATGINGRFVAQAGMWSHPYWSIGEGAGQLAFLRAVDPLDSQRSSYTLWLADRDGSNGRQVYPTPGESSRFPRERQFMAWGATGRDMAFIYNNSLYIFNLDSGLAHIITQDDAAARNPTWAPYGAGIAGSLPDTQVLPFPTPPPANSLLPVD